MRLIKLEECLLTPKILVEPPFCLPLNPSSLRLDELMISVLDPGANAAPLTAAEKSFKESLASAASSYFIALFFL